MADSKGSGHLSPPLTSSSGPPTSEWAEETAMETSSNISTSTPPTRSVKRTASSPPSSSKAGKSPRSMVCDSIKPLEKKMSSEASSPKDVPPCGYCEEQHYGYKCQIIAMNLMKVAPKSERESRKRKGLCEHCGVPSKQHLSLCPVLTEARIKFHRLKSEGCLDELVPFKVMARKSKSEAKSPQPPSKKTKEETFPGTSYREVVAGFYRRRNQINLPAESVFKLMVVQDDKSRDFPSLTPKQFDELQVLLFNIFTEQVSSGRQSYQTKDVYFDREATLLCCNAESLSFLKERLSAEPGFKAVTKRELLRLRVKLKYFKGSLGASSMLHKLVTKAWLEETGLPLLRKQLQLEEDHQIQLERFEQHQEVKLVVLALCEGTEKRWKSQDPSFVMNVGFKMVVFHPEAEEREELRQCLQKAKSQPAATSSRAGMSKAERLSADLLAVSVARETDGSIAALVRSSNKSSGGGSTSAVAEGDAGNPPLNFEAGIRSPADPEASVGGSEPHVT